MATHQEHTSSPFRPMALGILGFLAASLVVFGIGCIPAVNLDSPRAPQEQQAHEVKKVPVEVSAEEPAPAAEEAPGELPPDIDLETLELLRTLRDSWAQVE